MKPYYKYYELNAIEKGNWVLFQDLEHYFQVVKVTFDYIKINIVWVDYTDNLQQWETTKTFTTIQEFNKWYMKAIKEWTYARQNH